MVTATKWVGFQLEVHLEMDEEVNVLPRFKRHEGAESSHRGSYQENVA